MNRKIILSCFLLAVSLFLAATVALGSFAYFAYAQNYGADNATAMILDLIGAFLVVFTVVLAVALAVSARIAAGILHPIRHLDRKSVV